MKFCYSCGHATTGDPLFCVWCGRSYDVKLCRRHHVNPRYAEACSQCGSRELSTPQPKVSLWWKVLGFLLRMLSGILLVLISLAVALELLRSPAVQDSLIALVLLVAVLWALWAMLPEWFRKFVHWLLERRIRRHER